MGLKIGGDWKLYYNSGTNASPTWVEINLVGDINLNLSVGEAAANLRVSGWDLNAP